MRQGKREEKLGNVNSMEGKWHHWEQLLDFSIWFLQIWQVLLGCFQKRRPNNTQVQDIESISKQWQVITRAWHQIDDGIPSNPLGRSHWLELHKHWKLPLLLVRCGYWGKGARSEVWRQLWSSKPDHQASWDPQVWLQCNQCADLSPSPKP